MSFVAFLSFDLKTKNYILHSLGHRSFRCILNIRTPYRLELTQTLSKPSYAEDPWARHGFMRSATPSGFSLFNYAQHRPSEPKPETYVAQTTMPFVAKVNGEKP